MVGGWDSAKAGNGRVLLIAGEPGIGKSRAVCGAVQPYNAILGGKLVAMLAASPEIVVEYRHRYSAAQSEIASSMAGRPIVRTPVLVLLGTTSLYGVGSSQYNRIEIPCDRIGGTAGEQNSVPGARPLGSVRDFAVLRADGGRLGGPRATVDEWRAPK